MPQKIDMRCRRIGFSMQSVEIVGATGTIIDVDSFLDRMNELTDERVLVLNADIVCGRDHLLSAVSHAARAFERGRNVSSTLAMETLLYASGERQIQRATKKTGISEGEARLVLVFFREGGADDVLLSAGLRRDDSVLSPSKEKLIRFGIGTEEIGAVPDRDQADLVLERVAFVDLQKR